MFINQKGEILIYRVYKDDITRSECQQFCSRVVATKENKESPIIYINGTLVILGTSYIHIQHKDMIILAATKCNVNVAMVLQFLYSIIMICKSYFKGELDEKCIKENFVLIYELLDGRRDFKYVKRNLRLRHPANNGRGAAEAVHPGGRAEDGDHERHSEAEAADAAGDGGDELAPGGHQVQAQRGLHRHHRAHQHAVLEPE